MTKESGVTFLQKRWVRVAAVFPALLYTAAVCVIATGVFMSTVFRPPNKIFPMTDLVGWLGYLFFLGIYAAIGVAAILTGYLMRGHFRILYWVGGLAVLTALMFLPLSFAFPGHAETQVIVDDPMFLAGQWKDDYHQLELREDGSFALETDGTWLFGGEVTHHAGEWSLDRWDLSLRDSANGWFATWEISRSDTFYFITYTIPDNFDGWDGYLGLMRPAEYDATH
ncbi:MAG: hypothetical protein ABIE70_04370 [bacterium]